MARSTKILIAVILTALVGILTFKIVQWSLEPGPESNAAAMQGEEVDDENLVP